MKTSILFGGKFDSDPLAQKIMSNIATWPKAKSDLTDRLGNYSQIVRWKARHGNKRKTVFEARNHPAVDWLLDVIIPALCARDARPFRLIADAIETHKTNAFPAHQISLATIQLALELAALPMPFNDVGESADEEIELPKIIRVAVTESTLRRKLEKRLHLEINPGTFTRILKRHGIRCHKKNSGGRGRKRKVLHTRGRRQKPDR
jgi:hypothetical protein